MNMNDIRNNNIYISHTKTRESGITFSEHTLWRRIAFFPYQLNRWLANLQMSMCGGD